MLAWTKQDDTGVRDSWYLTMSADDMKIATAVYNGYIYTSVDGGAHWTQRTSAGQRDWSSPVMSADGARLIAPNSNYGIFDSPRLSASSDYGQTWVERTGAGTAYTWSLDMSTDGGHNWVQQTDIVTAESTWPVWSILMSADGSVMAAAGGYDNGVYISVDGGSNWVKQTSLLDGMNGKSVTVSKDGTFVAVLSDDDSGKELYTATVTR